MTLLPSSFYGERYPFVLVPSTYVNMSIAREEISYDHEMSYSSQALLLLRGCSSGCLGQQAPSALSPHPPPPTPLCHKPTLQGVEQRWNTVGSWGDLLKLGQPFCQEFYSTLTASLAHKSSAP